MAVRRRLRPPARTSGSRSTSVWATRANYRSRTRRSGGGRPAATSALIVAHGLQPVVDALLGAADVAGLVGLAEEVVVRRPRPRPGHRAAGVDLVAVILHGAAL